MSGAGKAIRVGIGGWTFKPWRNGAFYPKGWPQGRELAYASSQLSAIEINGTFYSSQNPATFAKWRDEVPDDFAFSLKASRFAELATRAVTPRDVFMFFVSGAKERAPAAAMALRQRLAA